MKTFDYHKPNSVSEAVALMSNEKDSRPIAGGMSLLPTMKQRLAAPEVLVDLSGIVALKGIEAGAGAITVGATPAKQVRRIA
jgi:carbon-monoxide dehydrogenase medium subunit